MTYDEKICVVCGKPYIPIRFTQVTCATKECQTTYRRAKQREYNRKRYVPSYRKEITRIPKPDTIVAIGYADRQRAETLKMVGKIKTEL